MDHISNDYKVKPYNILSLKTPDERLSDIAAIEQFYLTGGIVSGVAGVLVVLLVALIFGPIAFSGVLQIPANGSLHISLVVVVSIAVVIVAIALNRLLKRQFERVQYILMYPEQPYTHKSYGLSYEYVRNANWAMGRPSDCTFDGPFIAYLYKDLMSFHDALTPENKSSFDHPLSEKAPVENCLPKK